MEYLKKMKKNRPTESYPKRIHPTENHPKGSHPIERYPIENRRMRTRNC